MGAPLDLAKALGRLAHSLERSVGQGADEVHWDVRWPRLFGQPGGSVKVYDREMYKRRNEIERLDRRIRGFRRIFSRFKKLDALFLGFVHFALIYDAVR